MLIHVVLNMYRQLYGMFGRSRRHLVGGLKALPPTPQRTLVAYYCGASACWHVGIFQYLYSCLSICSCLDTLLSCKKRESHRCVFSYRLYGWREKNKVFFLLIMNFSDWIILDFRVACSGAENVRNLYRISMKEEIVYFSMGPTATATDMNYSKAWGNARFGILGLQLMVVVFQNVFFLYQWMNRFSCTLFYFFFFPNMIRFSVYPTTDIASFHYRKT